MAEILDTIRQAANTDCDVRRSEVLFQCSRKWGCKWMTGIQPYHPCLLGFCGTDMELVTGSIGEGQPSLF